MAYRPDIDGLRAVAVLSVLLYHYGLPVVSGGFVGVDIFFVISGYLITGLLAEGIAKSGLSLGDFYNRRIRRIFPAMLVVLGLALAAGWFLLLPGDYAELGRSAAYSAFGAGNFYFFWHTGYFDRTANLLPLLHMWSLGVEEQFYLVWPTLLALLMWLTRGRRALLAALIGVIIVASFVASLRLMALDPKAAFYLPHARAWELAMGALLVFLPAIPSRAAAEIAGIAGLALIAYAVFHLTTADPFPGANAVVPCLGSALIIWPRNEASWTARLLSVFPLRRTGEISYSLYLWHWPLLVLFRHYDNNATPTGLAAVSFGVVAYVLAFLSWRYVERPFRRSTVGPARMIVGGLVAASLVLAAGLGVYQAEGFVDRISPAVAGLQSLDEMWKWECPSTIKLPELGMAYCAFGKPWDKAKTKALLWGDSHAEHMAPIVEAAAKGLPDSFLLYRTCPAALGDHVTVVNPALPAYVGDCKTARADAIRLLKDRSDINLVIFAAAWRNVAGIVSQDGTLAKDSDGVALIRSGLESLLDEIAARGRRFLIIADVPQASFDPVPCAIVRQLGLLRAQCDDKNSRISRAFFESFQRKIYNAFEDIASNRTDTSVILPGNALCKGDWCQMYLDGEFLYRDGSHIRRNLQEKTKEDYANIIGLPQALAIGRGGLVPAHWDSTTTR